MNRIKYTCSHFVHAWQSIGSSNGESRLHCAVARNVNFIDFLSEHSQSHSLINYLAGTFSELKQVNEIRSSDMNLTVAVLCACRYDTIRYDGVYKSHTQPIFYYLSMFQRLSRMHLYIYNIYTKMKCVCVCVYHMTAGAWARECIDIYSHSHKLTNELHNKCMIFCEWDWQSSHINAHYFMM